jgi:hypothetical protein
VVLSNPLQGNTIFDNKQILQIWKNYITYIYDGESPPGNLEVETKVDREKKDPHLLDSEMGEKNYQWVEG